MLAQKSYRINPLTGIIMLVVFGVLMYLLFKGIYIFANWAFPVLAIATLLINYKVYINYFQKNVNRIRTQPLWGILRLTIDVLVFPLTILWLFIKAVFGRLVAQNVKGHPIFQDQHHDGDFIPYEEVEDEPVTTLELPPIQKKAKEKNIFDDYFQ